jgi:anti-sigma factor RsiW
MTCDHCRPLLDAYVDGELDVRAALEVEAHLSSCAACAARHATKRALSQSVRAHASRFAPSADFERKLRATSTGAQPQLSPLPQVRWRLVTAALACAAAIVLVWFGALRFARPDTEHRIADEVVAAHVRSLLVDHLTDVASTDRHTVNPWFQGKIPFAVGARDFAAQGFALEGGRLDYVDGKAVAALVYRHGPHALNVFVWPTDGDSDSRTSLLSVRGYSTDHWIQSGMQYWIVSDADASTLAGLAGLLKARD